MFAHVVQGTNLTETDFANLFVKNLVESMASVQIQAFAYAIQVLVVTNARWLAAKVRNLL